MIPVEYFDKIMKYEIEIILNLFCYTLMLTQAAAQNVVLRSHRYVQKSQPIRLDCSSDIVPLGSSAEFLVDGKTITNIKYDNRSCYKTFNNQRCDESICNCGDDGKSYVLFYKSYDSKPDSDVMLMCTMKFSGNRAKISNKINVTIIDLQKPTIVAKEKMPFLSGSTVNLICIIHSTLNNFNLKWQCDEFKYEKELFRNATDTWSTLQLKVDFSNNNEQCICVAQSKVVDFNISSKFTLVVTAEPILIMDSKFVCNRSHTIAIPCLVQGEMKSFGFTNWTHSINRTYIRTLQAKTSKYISVILIEDCSYQDAGDYTCSVWNSNRNKTTISNKTTTLYINGPLIVKQKDIWKQKQETTFSLQFYSQSRIHYVKWYYKGLEINSSANTEISLGIIETEIVFHGEVVPVDGHKAQIITTSNEYHTSKYEVCIQNDYGLKCAKFESKNENTSNLPMFIVTGVGSIGLIVLIILSTYIITRRLIVSKTIIVDINQQNSGNVQERPHGISRQSETNQQRVQSAINNDNGIHMNTTDQIDDEGYEIPYHPYCIILPDQTQRDCPDTENNYLDVEHERENSFCSTMSSEKYEKV